MTVQEIREKVEAMLIEEPHNEALLRLLDWILTGRDSV